MKSPASIGLLGGSFDPVHNGHLVLARDLRERLALDQLLLVPAARSPFKAAQGHAASASQRLAMCRLAVRGEAGLGVSSEEIGRAGPSYTVDTVRAFRRRHTGARLVWVVGADHVAGLPAWHEAQALLGLCEIQVMGRGQADETTFREALALLPPVFQDHLRGRWLELRRMDVSSTEVRDRARRGLSNKGLVPDAVIAYIARHSLYA